MMQLNDDNNELKNKIKYLTDENIKLKNAIKLIMTKIPTFT